jgi:transcriptional regulator with XRE-family HTH domain
LRQVDVAERAGVSHTLISLVERGHCDRMSLRALRSVAATLDVRLDLVPRWRGGELDRLLNARHAALAGQVISLLKSAGWQVVPEVSFAIYGERGLIDLLAWHSATQTLLVIELKTEIVDVSETLGTLDRKTRLARKIASERGWQAASVATLLVVSESSTNRRRTSEHGAILRAALPNDGREARRWLRSPSGRFAGSMFLSHATAGNGRARNAPVKRVRRPFEGRARA